MLVGDESSLSCLWKSRQESFSSCTPVLRECPVGCAHCLANIFLCVAQTCGESAVDCVQVCRDLFNVVVIGSDEDSEPFGCGDTRRLSLVAGGRCDVVEDTSVIAGIADNRFEGLAAILLADRLRESADVDQWREDDVKHWMDVWTKCFGDFLKSLASLIGQLSAFRFGASHEAVDDVTNACGETSGLLLGGFAFAEGWNDIATCFVSLGPVVLRLLALEDVHEVLKDSLHDFDTGGVWSVEDEEVVVIRAKKDGQQFLIVDVIGPKEGGSGENKGFSGRLIIYQEDTVDAESKKGNYEIYNCQKLAGEVGRSDH
jgi:hypothetical protein